MAHASESVAIYWDFENLHANLVDQAHGQGAYLASRFRPQEELVDVQTIVEYALSLGPIAINRAFANWVSFNRYKQSLLQAAIELIQVFPPGANAKNGADIKLCLDVMEDMVRFPHIGTIIVVGGDSDYMPLSYKVKAAGRTLVGIGSRRGTNQHWARSCHEFKFYEGLLAPAVPIAEVVPTVQPPAEPSEPIATGDAVVTSIEPAAPGVESADEPGQAVTQLEEMRMLLDVAETEAAQRKAGRELVGKAIARLVQNRGETWIQKARLRPFIQRIDSTFHESSYGFATFNEMLASMNDLVEVRRGEFDHELRLRPATSGPVS
ncbi:NYN domain-containing protein [Piscinibacter sp.]|uniref:NYN domain-containing protein n=1 Tax=Piscinibacter sp. TaxID=1903157 RepID=UPI0039E6B178